MKPPKPTLQTILGRINLWEEKINELEYKFQETKAPSDALNLAKAKEALLATQLLVWTCCRVGDIRRLVVNWDVAAVLDPNGLESIYVAPMEDKTNWRQQTTVQVKDIGKQLHPRLAGLLFSFCPQTGLLHKLVSSINW